MGINFDLKVIKIGLLITLLSLIFGIGLGIAFGAKEEVFKTIFLKILKLIQQYMMKKVKIKFGDMCKEHTFIQLELLLIL